MTRHGKEMLLKDFIADTLVAITEGIVLAKESDAIKIHGVEISPPETGNDKGRGLPSQRLIREITFDVSLRVSTSAGGSIGVALPGVGGIFGHKKRGGDASLNKVKFVIPITYPGEAFPKNRGTEL